jgi:N-acetylglucosamine-6-phosphate deacetylase
MPFAIIGARVFDGTRLLDGHAVLVEGERIVAVLGADELPAGTHRVRVEGLVAPGLIDVQVNGGGGVLFNDVRTAGGIAAIGAAHRRFGTTGFLPTLITDTRVHMAEAIEAARAALAAKVPGVLGIHLEGPFLNPERKGVHDPRLMRPIETADIALVTSLKAGVTLMTIAPEKVPVDVVARLAGAGVILSAGHTAARYDTVVAARGAGLTGFTHLYNAMPPLGSREPGPVGAALADPEAYVGIIADLFHVSATALRIAIRAHGAERMMLITDAMPSVGSELTEFLIDGNVITRSNGRLTRADGTIAGSDLDMATAVRNAVRALGLPVETALQMASRWPAEFLGLGGELGRIAPGYRADLTLFDDTLAVTETWIAGRSSREG